MSDDRPVALVGFMTAGKTSIGPQLAMLLDLDFVDLDAALQEQERATIGQLFARFGEAGFRDREAQLLGRLLAGPPVVLATGGGVVGREENRRCLATRARVVWVDVRFETVRARLREEEGRDRPLAASLGSDGLRALHQARRPLYASCAALRVDGDRDAPGRLARRIALHLRRAAESA